MQVRPVFVSSETFNKLHLQYRKVGVARFPNVAALTCCESSYAEGTGAAARRGMKCFAKACFRATCPSGAQLPTPRCAHNGAIDGPNHLAFKYVDEGHSALVHGTALALPGATWEVADDATPGRLHIRVPGAVVAATAGRAASHGGGGSSSSGGGGGRGGIVTSGSDGSGLLYTCKTCEGGPDVPDPVSINVTSCLFRRHPYAHPTLEAARKVHPCRYFDTAVLATVCAQLGTKEVRTGSLGWFCNDAEMLASAI